MSKRFAIFAAVSSLPQAKKVSLQDQVRICREHVARHNGEVVAELIVPGESRNIVLFEEAARRMDAYRQLKELIDQRSIDVLIFLDRSRLGRKASLSMAVVELCHEAGIATYETDAPPASLDAPRNGYDDLLIGAIKSVGAQQEIVKFQARHLSGMIGRVQRGAFPSKPPWGWQVRYTETGEQRIEIDPVAAPVIRMIFLELYLRRGLGRPEIAEELNRRGIPAPRGGKWSKGVLTGTFRLLRRYAGWSEINVKGNRPYTRAQGKFPAILTQSEMEQVLTERALRSYARRAVGMPYRFSLCVWCATCKTRMAVNSSIDARYPGGIRVTYRCRGKHRRTTVFETRVIRAVRETLLLWQVPGYLDTMMLDDQPDVDPILKEIEAVNAEIDKAQTALLRADDAYADGRMDRQRHARQVDRIQSQIATHEARLQELHAWLAAERKVATHRERIEEVATKGLEWLESSDVRSANANFRKYLQIWYFPDGSLEVKVP